ncbi:hypothetical protein H072_5686 [Dactylellina haptotyla CBS 200.50]|uniref:Uncharacterized protein n=1 Tax=Dactylellina haptotyla (strain CBS 200.50) TaxID=1284197 RepID=S8ABW3_DACHA|nr:hypothetical protein H072_5686 [Dactylellina haptotyla CBS 200.50]
MMRTSRIGPILSLKLFVKDSPLSRKDHEASPRHQHALQRFLRELHKNKEREAVAAENVKREAERLNNIDNPNYVAKPLARRAADLIEKKPAKSGNWRSEEQKQKHFDELAALGVAMPESYRKEHAMAGEWETVRVIEPPVASDEEDEEAKRTKRRKLGEVGDEDAEDEEEAAVNNFAVRTMDYPGDAAASSSENIGSLMFKKKKKKGSSKSGMRTIEYPSQSPQTGFGGIVLKRKGAKDDPTDESKDEGESVAKTSDETPVEEGLRDGVDELDRGSDQATREDQSEDAGLKHESSEDKPIAEEQAEKPAEEGVAFKARKARNANRRRI